MMRYSKEDLASTIFHECFHSTFFVKNNVDANEQLATFFAHYILLNYLHSNNKEHMATNQIISWEEEKKFSLFLKKTITQAKNFYTHEQSNRNVLFSKIKTSYMKELKPQTQINNYDSVFLNLNNAKLVAYKTYFFNFNTLEKLLQNDFNGDILIFLSYLKSLNKKNKKLFSKKLY